LTAKRIGTGMRARHAALASEVADADVQKDEFEFRS
jgi:hypothetical protein